MLLLGVNVNNVSCSLLFVCAGLSSPPGITLITVQFTKIYMAPALYNKKAEEKGTEICHLEKNSFKFCTISVNNFTAYLPLITPQ